MKTIEDAVRELSGVWPESAPSSEVLVFAGSVGWQSWKKDWFGKERDDWYEVCTRTEFEECARRLRNEPSFDDHPDAKCFVQNAGGTWFKNSNTTDVEAAHGHWLAADNHGVRGWCELRKGEVIGDWRDTLRLRSEEKKVENKAKERTLCANCATNKACPPANLSGAHQVFACAAYVPNTKDQNDWHKRGGHPPAGTECEVLYDGSWKQTKVIGWDGDKLVITTPWDDTVCYRGIAANPDIFRPLQTELERNVEKAITLLEAKTDKPLNAFAVGLVAYLIGAGFRMREDKP